MDIKNITFSYGMRIILDDVSLSVGKCELVGLLGLNGSGKTTLLKIICGILKSEGTCFDGEVNLTKLNPQKRAQFISFMPQSANIFYNLSVLDVVLLGITPHLSTFQTPNKAHRELAKGAIAEVNLTHKINDSFLNLSEGEKQLVTIARSIVQNAPYMIFDEPESALDHKNKHLILKKIRDIIVNEQKGGLITIHNPSFALNYCHKIIILKDAKIACTIDMNCATTSEIEGALSSIYGDVKVLKSDGRFGVI